MNAPFFVQHFIFVILIEKITACCFLGCGFILCLLCQNLTVAKNATVQMEGEREVRREIDYYNLDVIISVGYRVKSMRVVQFRQWATQTAPKSSLACQTCQ